MTKAQWFAIVGGMLLTMGLTAPLLLDGGGNWQGSVTALLTAGQDMVDASLELGVDSIS